MTDNTIIYVEPGYLPNSAILSKSHLKIFQLLCVRNNMKCFGYEPNKKTNKPTRFRIVC